MVRIPATTSAGRGPVPMWFSIDSEDGEIHLGDAEFASSIGTNLKKLNNAQMTVLMRHAGALCEARLRSWAPELLG